MFMQTFPFISRLKGLVQPYNVRGGAIGDVAVKSSFLAKGAEILAMGSTCRQLITIGEGIAMRYRLLPDGGRQIIMFLLPGDSCNTNLYSAAPLDHAIAAVTPVRIDRIEQTSMLALLKAMPEVNQALWAMAGLQEAIMRDRITSLGRCDARLRIAILLWELVHRLREAGEDTAPVSIPITQSLLADAVGVTPIHFNRVISEFCRMGVLATKRGIIFVVNPQALQDIASNVMVVN